MEPVDSFKRHQSTACGTLVLYIYKQGTVLDFLRFVSDFVFYAVSSDYAVIF